MPFVPAPQYVVNGHAQAQAGLVTLNNPAATNVPRNNRTWKVAVPRARSAVAHPVHAIPMSAVTGSEIVLRGDTRTPQAIEAAGGLYSQRVGQALPTQAVGPGTPMSAHRGPTVMEEYVHNPHDPDAHQAFAHATRFVSCTRDIGIAKGFATPHGHVYLARANVGVDYNAYRGGGNAGQAEVMVIQGLAMNDIIAARRMADNAIFVNSTFQQANMPQATFNAAMNLLMG